MINAEEHKKFSYLDIQLRPLFFLQEKLEEKYDSLHLPIDSEMKEERELKKELGLYSELGELSNALKLHKYWDNTPPEKKERILEEYVDGLHYVFAIGVSLGVKDYQYQGIYDEDITAEDLVYIFIQLYKINWLELKKSEYERALEMYLKLGFLLLFSWNEIKEMYVKKNLKNQELLEKRL